MNKSRVINLSIILLFIFLPILLWWKAFLLNGVFVYGDASASFFPFRAWTFQLLREGILPFWTPYIHNGHPLLAIFSIAVFYPLNLLFLPLPAYIGWNYSIIGHYILAGIFMYFYLKEIGLISSCALFGGIVFMFNGFLISHLEHNSMVASAIWLPLIFMVIEKAIKTKRYIYSIFLGLIIGTQFLAGYPQISLYILLALGSYVIFHLIFTGLKNKDFAIVKFLVSCVIIGLIIGVGLFSIQIFPTYELIKLSSRATGLPITDALDYSLHPKYLISLLMPYLHTDPFKMSYLSREYLNLTEVIGYCGVLSLLFGLFGTFFYRKRLTAYFTTLLLISLVLTFGKYTPLYSLIYHLPGFDIIRIPARFLYLYTFSLSILAAFGMQHLINSKRHPVTCKIMILLVIIISIFSSCYLILKPFIIKLIENIPSLISSYYTIYPFESYSHKIESLYSFILNSIIPFSGFFITSSLLIIVYLSGRIKLIHFKWLAILLVIIDLFIHWYSFNPMTKPEFYTSKPKTAQSLQKDNSLYRIISLIPQKCIEDSWLRDTALSWKFRETMVGNLGMLYGFQCMHGYTAPLTFFRWDKFITEFQQIPIQQHLKLLSLLNVKYVIICGEINDEKLELVGKYPYEVRIYKNKEVFPRAFIVHKVKIVQSELQSFNELMRKDFESKQYAILEEPVDNDIKQLNKSSFTSEKPQLVEDIFPNKFGYPTRDDKVEIVRYLPNQVIINAQLSNDGILVLTDTWYPGWKVYIDGKKGKIYKTNYLFRGIFLSSGKHQVRFVYDSFIFKVGAWISIITLLGTLAILIWAVSDKRIQNPQSKIENFKTVPLP